MSKSTRLFIGFMGLFGFAWSTAMAVGHHEIALGIAIGFLIGWIGRLVIATHA